MCYDLFYEVELVLKKYFMHFQNILSLATEITSRTLGKQGRRLIGLWFRRAEGEHFFKIGETRTIFNSDVTLLHENVN